MFGICTEGWHSTSTKTLRKGQGGMFPVQAMGAKWQLHKQWEVSSGCIFCPATSRLFANCQHTFSRQEPEGK